MQNQKFIVRFNPSRNLQSYSREMRFVLIGKNIVFLVDKTQGGRGIRIVGKLSWSDSELGKFNMKLERMKLESSGWIWKVTVKLESFKLSLKDSMKLESFHLSFQLLSELHVSPSLLFWPKIIALKKKLCFWSSNFQKFQTCIIFSGTH